MFHQYFRSNIVSAYHPRTSQAILQMLRSVRDTPERWLEHIHL